MLEARPGFIRMDIPESGVCARAPNHDALVSDWFVYIYYNHAFDPECHDRGECHFMSVCVSVFEHVFAIYQQEQSEGLQKSRRPHYPMYIHVSCTFKMRFF